MAKVRILPTAGANNVAKTVLLGEDKNVKYTSPNELNKAVSLVGESRYALAKADAEFEGYINSIEDHPSEGYVVGGIINTNYVKALATETLVIGDYIVCAAQPAVGTPTPAPSVKKAADAAAAKWKWRVVSLGEAGTGAAGTTVTIERV